jgi:hypothetical protein
MGANSKKRVDFVRVSARRFEVRRRSTRQHSESLNEDSLVSSSVLDGFVTLERPGAGAQTELCPARLYCRRFARRGEEPAAGRRLRHSGARGWTGDAGLPRSRTGCLARLHCQRHYPASRSMVSGSVSAAGPGRWPVPRARRSSLWTAHAPGGSRGVDGHEVKARFRRHRGGDFANGRRQPGVIDRAPPASILAWARRSCPGTSPRSLLRKEADEWAPWLHVAISNLKRFSLGTSRGAVHPRRACANTSKNLPVVSTVASGNPRSPFAS